jgi:hypothetical protein
LASLPDVDVLFSHFQLEAGSLGAARVKFQSLITDLVAVRHPDADEVAGPGGTDWGIDTYVGSLAKDVFVWQSKFFPTWTNKDPQQQVRDSFNQLLEKAAEHGLAVRSWTLCVPCILAPEQQLWFDRWAVRMNRAYGIEMEMWNGVRVRRYLEQPDASHLVRKYFPSYLSAPAIEDLEQTDDLAVYDEALFVRQLEAAGYTSTDNARGCFFAAEVVARDVLGRGDPSVVMALNEVDFEVHSAWELRFNTKAPSADASGRMANLITDVLGDVSGIQNPVGLNLRPAHRRGFMHRVVEDRRAGWVTYWREIASGASIEPPASEDLRMSPHD